MGGEGGAALHKRDRDGGLPVGDLSKIRSKLFPSSDEAAFHLFKIESVEVPNKSPDKNHSPPATELT